ncbi:hypothetical protein [Promicromonospora soli]
MPSPTVNFRATPPLDYYLQARAYDEDRTISAAARNGLLRYYRILDASLRGLSLTEAEASLICDALNGVWLRDGGSEEMIWAEISDAISYEGLDTKWGVDGASLVGTVRGWTLAQKVAVVDAVERFWSDTSRPSGEMLREAGLVRDAKPTT